MIDNLWKVSLRESRLEQCLFILTTHGRRRFWECRSEICSHFSVHRIRVWFKLEGLWGDKDMPPFPGEVKEGEFTSAPVVCGIFMVLVTSRVSNSLNRSGAIDAGDDEVRWTWIENWVSSRSRGLESVSWGPAGDVPLMVSPKVQYWAKHYLTYQWLGEGSVQFTGHWEVLSSSLTTHGWDERPKCPRVRKDPWQVGKMGTEGLSET